MWVLARHASLDEIRAEVQRPLAGETNGRESA
jgi:hypothetical protein